jgi:polyisoprenoid-binding protein YceI
MSKRTLLSLFAASATLLVIACKNEPKQGAETAAKPDTLQVAPRASEDGARIYAVTEGLVYWAGKKAVSNSQHNGSITVKSGEITVNEGQLLKGKIVLDMNSVTVLDLKDPGEKSDLESHLKDADFFETAKHPEGVFTFDETLPSNTPDFNMVIPGQLTLKGKTNAVNVPVKITLNGDELTAQSASFIINRTKWGINFRSGILGTAKDKLIEDNVPLQFSLKAKVAQ